MIKENKSVSIIIADDHKLFAEGLITMLAANHNYEKILYASNGIELLDQIKKAIPQLILMDIKMPGMNGIDALQIIKKQYPTIKVIMLSTFSDVDSINTCIYHGADAFLLKNVGIAELQHSIKEVLSNNRNFTSLLPKDNVLINKFSYFSQKYKLTKREWEIIQLIKHGNTNQQISEKLNVSIYTTETHRKNIMQKLQLKSPVALMKFIMNNEI